MANDVEFTEDQHKIWTTLYEKLWPRVQEHACNEFLEGAKILDLPRSRIPSVDDLNAKITPNTGWAVERTTVRYTDAVAWYGKFAQHTFLITDYMRS